jgi:hypothetical protein
MLGLLLLTRRFDQALSFWTAGIGCRIISQGNNSSGERWVHFRCGTPLFTWSTRLILAEYAGELETPCLDDLGFGCLAFVSTDVQKDGDRLLEAEAAERSGCFQLEVNHKTLRVELFRSPDRQIIELVEVGGNSYGQPDH